jgi:alpha-beta hydrolase superfamily lysophospholipase
MEKEILLSRDDLTIVCKLSLPDYGDIRRVVLGVHGFGGSTGDEIQAGIAEEMTLFHSASVRFDFPAHGESPMDSDAFTLDNCAKSLMAVAQYAREEFPHIEDLCIFASGFGAYVTLLCLQDLLEMPGKIKLVVQTPSLRMHDTLLAMTHLSEQTLRVMDRFTIPASRPFDVTYQFYKQLRANIALTTYPIPMLILHGEQDAYIPMEDIQNFHRINEDSELVIIPGTSHRFLEEGAWDMVLDLTRDWFEFEQVLLM